MTEQPSVLSTLSMRKFGFNEILCAQLTFLLEILIPLAKTVHSEKREWVVLFTKFEVSLLAASVPARRSASFAWVTLHLISKTIFWRSIKFFRSPNTSNSRTGPPGEKDGPTFWVKTFSKVTRSGGFSKRYRVGFSVKCLTSVLLKEKCFFVYLLLKPCFFRLPFRLLTLFWTDFPLLAR